MKTSKLGKIDWEALTVFVLIGIGFLNMTRYSINDVYFSTIGAGMLTIIGFGLFARLILEWLIEVLSK